MLSSLSYVFDIFAVFQAVWQDALRAKVSAAIIVELESPSNDVMKYAITSLAAYRI